MGTLAWRVTCDAGDPGTVLGRPSPERRTRQDRPVPQPPAYAIVHCEGRRCCVEVTALDDLADETVAEAEAVAFLERLAASFRAAGAIGRLVLLNRQTGEAVATRRVWP